MHFNSLPREGKGRGRPIDETGKRYGKLVVLSAALANSKETAAFWKCRCDCGSTSIVRGWMLRAGKSQSCGCVRRDLLRSLATLPPGEAALNSIIVNMQGNARRRNYEWQLDRATVAQLIALDCHYCGTPPMHLSKATNGDLRYNGLDRVDNSRGYVCDNVVPCCGVCNTAKSDMTQEQFLLWIRKVHERQAAK